MLRRKLLKLGFPVVLTREPGGTPLGDRVRRLLKWGKEITAQTELLFFLAARSQLVAEVIRPALEEGSIVVCDRYAASTVAYQGYGKGLDLGLMSTLNNLATGGLLPDLTVLLDIDPLEMRQEGSVRPLDWTEEGLRRNWSKRDRFEQEAFSFHKRVRQGYLKTAAGDPTRWLVVNGALPRKEVERQIWQRVKQLLD
jgi:dTMP kinase